MKKHLVVLLFIFYLKTYAQSELPNKSLQFNLNSVGYSKGSGVFANNVLFEKRFKHNIGVRVGLGYERQKFNMSAFQIQGNIITNTGSIVVEPIKYFEAYKRFTFYTGLSTKYNATKYFHSIDGVNQYGFASVNPLVGTMYKLSSLTYVNFAFSPVQGRVYKNDFSWQTNPINKITIGITKKIK